MRTNTRWFPKCMAVAALCIAGVDIASGQEEVCDSYPTAGGYNTLYGTGALAGLTSGNGNSAFGYQALAADGAGTGNTAVGYLTLSSNTGNCNTALGGLALNSNTTGANNTAIGFQALTGYTGITYDDGSNGNFGMSNGHNNTAVGASALYYNGAGSGNSAFGVSALLKNGTGIDNTAIGMTAMQGEHSGSLVGIPTNNGSHNTAVGFQALFSYLSASDNTAIGTSALYSDADGNLNTAIGYGALFRSTGDNNVAIGYAAGYNETVGNNNIYIGHPGEPTDSDTTRIGTPGMQTVVYVAGIENSKITGSAVYVTSAGRLGVLASSEQYKTGITPIGTSTEQLQRLRPVSFHLKTDPKGPVQYGLIAEEVNKIYPELVIRDEAGKIQGVHYEELAPMLLNEVQRQAAEIRDLKQQQKDEITAQNAKIRGLEQQVAELIDLKQEMRAALLKLQSRDQFVAQR
jgi:hypothetical protein